MHDWPRYVRERLTSLRVAPEREAEIVAELALQLEQACAEAIAAGASEGEAIERALAGFPAWEELAGEIEAAEVRPAQPLDWRATGGSRPGLLAGIFEDFRQAPRLLRRSPAFSAIAIATLAFGIGANTTIFTVVDAVERRSLPFPHADQLMAVETRNPRQPEIEPWTSAADFFDVRERARSFSALAAISPVWNLVLTGGRLGSAGSLPSDRSEGAGSLPSAWSGSGGEARRLECLYVSAELFPLLGVRPMLGRGFLRREDDRAAPARVVVLGHSFWRQRFGGAGGQAREATTGAAGAGAVGKVLDLDGEPYVVVGVLPADFHYPGEPLLGTATEIDLWLPLADNELMASKQRSLRFLKVVGRRRPGVAVEQARAELRGLGGGLAREHPDSNRGYELDAQPLHAQVAGRSRSLLLLLLGAVGFVLLMTCANVANLVLVRSAARQRETALRLALGAPAARLSRQLLAECLLLSLLGGAAGLGLAYGCSRALAVLGPPGLIPGGTLALGGASWLFTAGLVVACALACGLLPGWRLLRLEAAGSLRDAGAGLTARGHRLRAGLVAAEVAMALVLLVGAGLLVHSLLRLLAVDPGFDASHLVTVTTQMPPAARAPAERAALFRAIADRVAALPGVRSVAAVSRLPLSGANIGSWLFVEGRDVESGEQVPEVEYRVATPGYFATMGIPLRAGRLFDRRDEANASEVALINQSLARQFWPGGDPVGKRIKLGADPRRSPWITIVGVVGDVRHFGLDVDPRPEVYRPFAHNPLFNPILVIRTATDPASAIQPIAAAVRSVSSALPVYDARPMQELVDRSTARRRFLMWLLGAFAGAALLLAAVGVYGIAAQSFVQRTREIGLRMALGASPAAAIRLVLRDGARAIGAGIAAGSLAAAALTRAMASVLFAVSPLDPAVFALAALTLGACAALACYAPARRATRVDPLVALRQD